MNGVKIGMAVFVCVALLPCACQSSLSQAKKVLTMELSARRARRERSSESCKRGMEAYRKGDLETARRHLAEAVAMDDRNSHAWMALGVAEFKQDRVFEAARAFHKVAILEPDRYEPHFNMGAVFESVGRHKQAIEEYETALRLAPDQLEVMENLARCYVRSDTNLDKAKRLIKRALPLETRPDWRSWLQEMDPRLPPNSAKPAKQEHAR